VQCQRIVKSGGSGGNNLKGNIHLSKQGNRRLQPSILNSNFYYSPNTYSLTSYKLHSMRNSMVSTKPRVLLTASIHSLYSGSILTPSPQKNDDGPPGPESPYIFGLYRHLTTALGEQSLSCTRIVSTEYVGWDVKVVIPSSQKSWIGNALTPLQDLC
jgi:hypothetical protein